MERELQEYYEERFMMFSSKGWKDFIEDIKRVKEVIQNVEFCENLDFAKGQLKEINYILCLQELTEKAYKELTEDASV